MRFTSLNDQITLAYKFKMSSGSSVSQILIDFFLTKLRVAQQAQVPILDEGGPYRLLIFKIFGVGLVMENVDFH